MFSVFADERVNTMWKPYNNVQKLLLNFRINNLKYMIPKPP